MKGNFKVVFLIVFIVCAILAVLIFAGVIPLGVDDSKVTVTGTVTLWGTVKKDLVSKLFDEFNTKNETFVVRYVQKSPETFDQELLEAIASGVGPDMFFLPDNLAFSYSNKIYTIPYTSYPISSFKNAFASAGEVFVTSKGILAFPLTIDPLVMYYNRSILEDNNYVYPPVYWDELVGFVPIFTTRDEDKQIVKSAVALGQYSNINNAKDILTTLFMQAGSKIVVEKEGLFFTSDISDPTNFSSSSQMGQILAFYTSFADPLKENYSWNRSLPNSRDFFSADKSAFYFGFASELQTLINRNPNLNFAVTTIPQIKNVAYKTTSSRVTGVAISSFSKNFNTSYTAASLMATTDFAQKFADILGVAPARRDLLAKKPTDVYFPIFYSSALFARSWLDPSPSDTNTIFRGMVEKVLSNTLTTDAAIRDTSGKLNLLLK